VKYRFEITSTYSRKSVGSVGVRVDRKWSEGTVVSVDGTAIPQGEYALHAQDGEILRVDYLTANIPSKAGLTQDLPEIPRFKMEL
jgi:hypothetical protein